MSENEIHGIHPRYSEHQQNKKTAKQYAKDYIEMHGPIRKPKSDEQKEIEDQKVHQATISLALEIEKNFKLYSYRIISKEVFITLTQTLIDEYKQICSAD